MAEMIKSLEVQDEIFNIKVRNPKNTQNAGACVGHFLLTHLQEISGNAHKSQYLTIYSSNFLGRSSNSGKHGTHPKYILAHIDNANDFKLR